VTETVFRLKQHLTSFQIMILGFAGVILLGALVLMLPIATVQRVWTPFMRHCLPPLPLSA
jgi:trk system potassium uptake protein TrkH